MVRRTTKPKETKPTKTKGTRNTVTPNQWIKHIDINKELTISSFKLKSYFKKVANVVKDNDVNKNGEKKRKTIIKFEPCIPHGKWVEKSQWIYIFMINKRIVKIGGSRIGLRDRMSSYLSGHYTSERGGNNKMSTTNAYIYKTLDHYISKGSKVELYAYEIKNTFQSMNVFGKQKKVNTQTFHIYESACISTYYDQNKNKLPALSMNCDPLFR